MIAAQSLCNDHDRVFLVTHHTADLQAKPCDGPDRAEPYPLGIYERDVS